jgi:hypothetical protein
VIEATRDFLCELAAERDGQHIVIIAHSANRWALQVLLGGARIEDLVNAPFRWRPAGTSSSTGHRKCISEPPPNRVRQRVSESGWWLRPGRGGWCHCKLAGVAGQIQDRVGRTATGPPRRQRMSTGGQSPGPGPYLGRLQPISDGAARADPRFDGRARIAADFNHSTVSAYPRPGGRGRVRVRADINRSTTGRRESTRGPATGAGSASGPTSTSQRRNDGNQPGVRPPGPGPRQGRLQSLSDGAAGAGPGL